MEVTYAHKLNVALLEKKIAEEVWHNRLFLQMAGFNNYRDYNNGQDTPPLSGKPVEVIRSFVSEGRDNMLIPMLNRLTGNPVFGDTQVKGTGEEQTLRYLRVFINQFRKAAMKFSGRQSNQRVKMYDFPSKVEGQIKEHYGELLNAFHIQGMYEGASENLTAGTNDDGIGLYVRYHPNMYSYTASGVFTAIGTEFKTKTAAEIASHAADTKPDDDFLLEIAYIAYTNRINKCHNEGGDDFWLLVVHPFVFKLLMTDTTIASVQNAAYNAALMKHPYINGRQVLYMSGVAVVPDMLAARTWNSTHTRFVDSATNALTDSFGRTANAWMVPAASVSTTSIFACLLIGDGALAYGIGGEQDLYLTVEVDDHENVKEVAYASIAGVNRIEHFSSTDEASAFTVSAATRTVGSAYLAENTSSMIFLTRGS
jgi:hypothetical protein